MAPRPVSAGPSTGDVGSPSAIVSSHSFSTPSSYRTSSTSLKRLDVSVAPHKPQRLISRQNSNGSKFCNSCTIQNNSPRVVYTGNWVLTNERSGTTHRTTSNDASAALTFNGTKIMVFGTVPRGDSRTKGPVARYILDNVPVLTTTLPVAAQQIRNQAFFSAQDLNNTSLHTLKIEIITVDSKSPYILQRFFVRPHDQPSTDGQDDSVGDFPDSGGGDTIGSDDTPVMDADPMQIVNILAGVLGGLVALILLASLLYFIRRKMLKSRASGHIWSKFWRYSPGPTGPVPRPETMFTSITTPESIFRNDPASLLRGSSAFTRSDGRSELLRGSAFGPSPPPGPWITPPIPTKF